VSDKGYTLVDVEKRNREHPGFQILPRLDRELLEKGDYVQLIFSDRERMWVEVVRRFSSDNRVVYQGILTNVPVDHPDLNVGSPVEFRPEHVLNANCNSRHHRPKNVAT
jgi:hypothetical protein